jgi:16S rRNA (guanine527-N7)-methyltransferase
LEYLKSVFEKHGFSLTDTQAQQFKQYYEMLVEKNKVMNLTAITEYREVVVKHFLDSVYLAKYENLSECISLIDVGTGAGFPGIPLKIMFPDMDVVLLDSLNKRILFLQDVIEVLGLKKIKAIHGRAEEEAKKIEYREQFDYCVSRAVANLNSLSEICLPFVKVGGKFISYKSMKGMEELELAEKAICLLGGDETRSVEKFVLEENSTSVEPMERNFIRIKKIKATPKKYPRKPGTPFKEPLK